MKFLILLLLLTSVLLTQAGWPTDDTPKSKSLPSLEVKVAPPEVYQPKVQAEIRRLDMIREEKEYKYLESLESKYNAELISSGGKIKTIVNEALKVFEDPALLKKSVQYAMNPPVLQRGSKSQMSFKEKGFLAEKLPAQNNNNYNKNEKQANLDIAKLQKMTRDELIAQDHSARLLRQDSFRNTRFSEEMGRKLVQNADGSLTHPAGENKKVSGPLTDTVEGPINSYEAMLSFETSRTQKGLPNILTDQTNHGKTSSTDTKLNNGPKIGASSSFLPPKEVELDTSEPTNNNGNNGPVTNEKNNAESTSGPVSSKTFVDAPEVFTPPLDKDKNLNVNSQNDINNGEKSESRTTEPSSVGSKNGAVLPTSENAVFGPFTSSFLETSESDSSSSVQVKEGGPPLPPVLVKLYNAKDPDAKIQTEIEKLEKERDLFESKMFLKAEKELLLISKQTIQEFQANIEAEMLPYFMASKDVGAQLNSVIASSMGSQVSRFAEKYAPEMKTFFPRFMTMMDSEKNNDSGRQEETIEKMLETQDLENKGEEPEKENETNFLERNITLWNPSKRASENFGVTQRNEASSVRALLKKDSNSRKMEDRKINSNTVPMPSRETGVDEIQVHTSINELEGQEKEMEGALDEETCVELNKKYPYLDLGCKKKFAISKISFLQTAEEMQNEESQVGGGAGGAAGGGGGDNINVKLSASQTPYPTVYRLINEMQSRRDLAEKWERLKILEFEMNLQKAQDEMIKDALHQGLQKVISKFGPAIEGVQEDLRNT